MKKLHSQLLAILLCIIISLAFFSACDQSSGDATATPSGTVSQPPKDNSGSDEQPGQTGMLPIVDDSVTITYWHPIEHKATAVASFEDVEVAGIYETMTNVKVNWICAASGEEQTQFNLMMAGEDYPDMAYHSTAAYGDTMYTSGAAQAIDDGVFLELTDVIEQYMPNYKRERVANEDRRIYTTMDDGRLWGVFVLYDRPEANWRGLSINQQLWDEYELDAPVTLSDWDEQLSLLNREMGGQLFMYQTGLTYDSNFLSAWDIGNDFYVDTEGKVQYGPIQDDFREFLAMMNDWYNRGLISQDFTSVNAGFMNSTDNQAKVINREYVGGLGMHGMIANYWYDTGRVDDPDFWFTPVTPPVHNEGDTIRFGAKLSPIKHGTNIFADSEHVEVCAKWLDYFYSAEGQLFLNYGVEGTHYNVGDDGTIYTTDYMKYNDQELPYTTWMHTKLFGYHFPGVTYIDYMFFHMNCQGWRDGEDGFEAPIFTSDYGGSVWDEQVTNTATIPSSLSLSAEEGSTYSKKYTDIETYLFENVARFITGARSLDEFEDFRAQIKSMDIQSCIDIKQAGYDRFYQR